MQIVFQDPYSSLNPRMRVAADRRGAAHHPPARRRGRRGARASRSCSALVGLDPGAPRALSARVQRRPAPADRPGARARAEPVVRHSRRAGVGARRVGAGAGRQPADGSAAAAEADLSVHRARSAAGRAHLQPRRGDVSGKDRRDGRRRRSSPRRSIPTRGRCCRRFPFPIPTRRASASCSIRRRSIAPRRLREMAQGHFAAV